MPGSPPREGCLPVPCGRLEEAVLLAHVSSVCILHTHSYSLAGLGYAANRASPFRQLLNESGDLLRLGRLAQASVIAGCKRPLDVPLGPKSGQGDSGCIIQLGYLANGTDQFVSVDDGHSDIGDEQVR